MMTVNLSLISGRENVGRKTDKKLNLPLHMHALHIIVQENDDQQIKKKYQIEIPGVLQNFQIP